jgi:hypothetical protein
MARPNRPHWHKKRKRWRVRVDGVEYWHPTLKEDQASEAWDWLTEIKQRSKQESPTTPSKQGTLRGYYEGYLLKLEWEMRRGRISKPEFERSKKHLRRFSDLFGELEMSRITRRHLTAFRLWAEEVNKLQFQRSLTKSIDTFIRWVNGEGAET